MFNEIAFTVMVFGAWSLLVLFLWLTSEGRRARGEIMSFAIGVRRRDGTSFDVHVAAATPAEAVQVMRGVARHLAGVGYYVADAPAPVTPPPQPVTVAPGPAG